MEAQHLALQLPVEVRSGPFAELRGVVTAWTPKRDYVWARLDGDVYDLRFKTELLERIAAPAILGPAPTMKFDGAAT